MRGLEGPSNRMLRWLGSSPHSAPPDATPAEPESPNASLLVPWSEVAQGTALTSVFVTDQLSTSTGMEQSSPCDGPSPDGQTASGSQLNEEGGLLASRPPIPKWFWGALAALILYDLYIYRAIMTETVRSLFHG